MANTKPTDQHHGKNNGSSREPGLFLIYENLYNCWRYKFLRFKIKFDLGFCTPHNRIHFCCDGHATVCQKLFWYNLYINYHLHLLMSVHIYVIISLYSCSDKVHLFPDGELPRFV